MALLTNLESALEEFKINLNNSTIQRVLDTEKYDVSQLEKAIDKFLDKEYEFSESIDSDKLYNKVKELVNYTNDENFYIYIHKFINLTNYLISMSEKLHKNINNSEIIITKEDFFNRYDRLITELKPFEEESNLILYTKAEKVPFKVFKNTNNQISVLAGEEKAKLSFTKDRLASIIFDGKDIDYHKSYTEVLIEKILDNSIFDEIKQGLNFSFMPETKIKKLEEENDKLTGQIQKLTEKINQKENDYDVINNLAKIASTAEKEFLNAKETVLKEIKLQEAYKYWENEVKDYSKKYWIYLATSIVSSILLLFFVFKFLDKNPLIIEYTNKADIKVLISKDNNSIKNQDDIKVENIQLWKYGFLILLTTMVIWLIRILVKITLSNYHLSVDARERVIMIRTYLSLLKEGESFEKEDKKVMLDNIFRPTNFGIISDETSVTLTDIISSFKK